MNILDNIYERITSCYRLEIMEWVISFNFFSVLSHFKISESSILSLGLVFYLGNKKSH